MVVRGGTHVEVLLLQRPASTRPAPCQLPLQGKQPEDLEPTSIRSPVLRLQEVIKRPPSRHPTTKQ
jgi:hypothetical protein